MKAPNRIIISPKTYVLEKMSEQELKEKEIEKIFLHKNKETVYEQNKFLNYMSKDKKIRRIKWTYYR